MRGPYRTTPIHNEVALSWGTRTLRLPKVPELVSFPDNQPSEFVEVDLDALKARLEILFDRFTARLR